MLRREMRLSEQRNDERVRIAAAEFGNLIGRMAIAGSDLAQVFARHAIKAVDGGAAVAGGGEQFVKWSPVVSPVEFEPDALAKLAFVNFAAEPFVENMLVAGKNSFHSQHYRAPVEFEIAEERSQIALRIGQGMIVADQDDSRFGDFLADIIGVQNFLIGAIGVAKVAEIFAPAGRINGADLTLDARDGVELCGTAPRS